LLALNNPELDSLIVAHCQEFGIACRLASFLMLENEADYKRLNLQVERGRMVPGGDLGQFLETAWSLLGQVTTARDSLERFLRRIEPRVHFLSDHPSAIVRLSSDNAGANVRQLLGMLTEADCELPQNNLHGRLVAKN